MSDLTDLEITRACAEAMGLRYDGGDFADESIYANYGVYSPLHNKAQAFELVERFGLNVQAPIPQDKTWTVYPAELGMQDRGADAADLCRAICIAVANIHRAKAGQ